MFKITSVYIYEKLSVKRLTCKQSLKQIRGDNY